MAFASCSVLHTFWVNPERPHFLSDRYEVQFSQRLAPDSRDQPLHFVEFALVPPVECLFLGRLIEHGPRFHRSTARPGYLVTQLDMVAEQIVNREIGMEAAWRASPFRKLVGDVPNDYFGRAALGRLLRQVSQGLDVKDRANNGHEQVIKPDRLIRADRL